MQKTLIKNRKARHNFEILDKFSAGIVLLGHEVKSLKSGGGNFTGAYVTFENEEAFLKGFNIALYSKASVDGYEPARQRKLLLHKNELEKIAGTLNTKGVTLIPLSCGLNKGKVKIEIALARGKKLHDKRESKKAKDISRRLKHIV